MTQPQPLPRLIAFAPSHFCERARWALDYVGVAYREERWAPGPHKFLAKRLGLSSSTTPILDLGNGQVIQGSDKILTWTGLRGGDADVEQRFETCIGPLARQFFYAAVLGNPRSGVRSVLFDGVSTTQTFAAILLWPRTRRRMMQLMNARADLLPVLTERLEAELAWFEGVLGERGKHLVGHTFGRADLTAASLWAPLALPPTHPVVALYAKVVFPTAEQTTISGWRNRPSIAWVRDIYADHRRSCQAAGAGRGVWDGRPTFRSRTHDGWHG
ncbi:glutathione S-transferase N-terminal domain-containing protein [Methylobacterium nigriterrae]|uniref:glutathione S-transferase N-terminal domain-containing protein n=1 Tax=Methylobacterium nigriterrae TaxID=3127512 RepID=UPI003013F684